MIHNTEITNQITNQNTNQNKILLKHKLLKTSKIIRFTLIFSLLFSSATYHTQAQAGVLKTTRNIIITVSVIAGIYYLAKKFGESEGPNDSQEMRNLKKTFRKVTLNTNNTGKAFNNSIEKNFGINPEENIKKVADKIVNVIKDTKDSIRQGVDNLVLTPEQRAQKFGKIFKNDLIEIANGNKDLFKGGCDLLKKSTQFIKNEFENLE